ncbi:hypothetical protein KM176_16640 [Pseudooceanicola sp. CBS1P-1]|uniref:Uncharacterized protein n=1 Tax=Pseudooceanicola albus TaxID=2692189 RepID=A0A6L7G3Z5_9RHOB|nr:MULTISPECIES: hypothetical protein [Pseudooceanicola]MBT9385504.1 hypothetical protein [Pseudooceanicola endophyticus]MXN19084.1 hypothetical protein [Pseudooceanicola albus]
MSLTLTSHMHDCKSIGEAIANANALLVKTQTELQHTREVLEMLREYQHPKLVIQTTYKHWLTEEKALQPVKLIDAQIARINTLLGDRA